MTIRDHRMILSIARHALPEPELVGLEAVLVRIRGCEISLRVVLSEDATEVVVDEAETIGTYLMAEVDDRYLLDDEILTLREGLFEEFESYLIVFRRS